MKLLSHITYTQYNIFNCWSFVYCCFHPLCWFLVLEVGEYLMNLTQMEPITSHWVWMRIHIDWRMSFHDELSSWVALCDDTFSVLVCQMTFYINLMVSVKLMIQLNSSCVQWTLISPGRYNWFWECISCWTPDASGHPVWLKSKINRLGGISLAKYSCLAVSRYNVKFPPPPYVIFSNYPAQAALAVPIFEVWPNIPLLRGCSCIYCESKVVHKVEH